MTEMPHEQVALRPPARAEKVALAAGHRLGAAALLLLVAGAGLLLSRKPHGVPLLLAFGAADVALLGAFVSLVLGRRRGGRAREAMGASVFCGVVLLASLALVVVSRLRDTR